MNPAPVLWIGRAQERAAAWSAAASSCGWHAHSLPLIGTKALPLPERHQNLVTGLCEEDTLFLTSAEAVRRFFAVVNKGGIVPNCRIAVVGPATAEALRAGSAECAGVEPCLIAPENTGASLAAAFIKAAPNPAAKRVFFGAQDPSPELGLALAAAELPITIVPAYHVVGLKGSPPPEGDLVLLFSPSGAESLGRRVACAAKHPVVAVGPTTAAAAHHADFTLRGVLASPHPSSLAAFLTA